MIDTERSEDCFDKFIERQLNGFLYTAKNPVTGKWSIVAALETVRTFGELYAKKYNAGAISVSCYEIVLQELLDDGSLRRIAVESEPEVPELTVEVYNRMPATQITFKYKSDPGFREQVDSLIARGLI
jgi:hypothetical protein